MGLKAYDVPPLRHAIHSGGDARSPHLWVPLVDASAEARAVALLNQLGVGVTAGEAFRVGATPSYGFALVSARRDRWRC